MTTAKLKLEEYALRPLALEDADMVRAWRNQEHIREVMYHDHEIGGQEHVEWMQKVIEEDSSDYFIVTYLDKPIGLCGLYGISQKDGRAVWAFYLGEENTPLGAGSAMWFLLLDYAFQQKGLRKICSEVLAINEKVLAMHERFGFVQEGVLRAQAMKGGNPIDAIMFGLLRDEWRVARNDQWYIETIPEWKTQFKVTRRE